MSNIKRIPTSEEYEEDKQLILSLLKEGLPMRRMFARLDYTRTYITNMKKTLIAEGLITEEEIKSAFEQYMKENPAAQGLNKTKVRKPKSTEKAERRHNRSVENKEKVFELVGKRYNKTQIARTLQITATAVDYHIKKLIEERKN